MSKSLTNVPALSTFVFEKSYQIRIISQNGDPWFIAADVCNALGIRNVTQALEKLDEDERSILNIGLNDERSNCKLGLELTSTFDNRIKEINIISESGLYFLVLRSRNATKKGSLSHRFRKWVTSEVLPSIRKTGSYVQTITPAQQREIQKLVADRVYASNLANTSMGFSAMYRALKDRFCIASYNQLPAVQFDEAVQFIADCPIETPKPTSEKLTPNDMTNIRRLLWAVSGQLNGGQSFVNMLWGCLREVTGRKSPSPFYVEDIPVIAKELKRIGEVLQPLSDAIYYAKKSAFRRLVKNREDVEKVMKEVKEQMNLDLLLKWKPSFMETEAFNRLLMRVKNPLPTSMEGYQEN